MKRRPNGIRTVKFIRGSLPRTTATASGNTTTTEQTEIIQSTITQGKQIFSSPGGRRPNMLQFEKIVNFEASKNRDETVAYKKAEKNKNEIIDGIHDVREMLESRNTILEELIGSGSYAEVYRGRITDVNRLVAIKIIDLNKVNIHYRTNFLPREISLIRKLHHPSIVKIFTISQVNFKVVIVMEYASNGTLSDRIAQTGAFSEVFALYFFRKIFEALYYMHNMSMAHRDLKLENILINNKNLPKLADFSFTVQFDGHTLCSDFCGSLPYFAPELLENKPYNPLAADVWSLGICIFIATNDRFPFNLNLKERQILELQKKRQFKFRPKTENIFTECYKNLVRKMMEPNIPMRITMEIAIKHEWFECEIK